MPPPNDLHGLAQRLDVLEAAVATWQAQAATWQAQVDLLTARVTALQVEAAAAAVAAAAALSVAATVETRLVAHEAETARITARLGARGN
jgi:hypothetical protein